MPGRTAGVPAGPTYRNTRRVQKEGGDRAELLQGPGQALQAPDLPPQGAEAEARWVEHSLINRNLETTGGGDKEGWERSRGHRGDLQQQHHHPVHRHTRGYHQDV